MSHIYNIKSHLPFAENFATGLMKKYKGNLPDVHIYLPTVRSIKSLSDGFLKLSKGAPLLLPCMYSLADVPEDEMDFAADVGGDLLMQKPIGKQERLFLLGKLVQKFMPKETHANVLVLARSLEQFLDMMQISEVPLARLENLCPDDYAHHWRKILNFLFILKDRWQPILQDKNAEDIMQHQNNLLDRLGEFLQQARMTDTRKAVIVAGTTGSRTAVRRFAKIVSALPHGVVVLPGVDTICTEAEWQAIKNDPCHPQYNLHRFLRDLNIARTDLQDWHAGKGNEERLHFLSHAMRSSKITEPSPPSPTSCIPEYQGDIKKAMQGVLKYDCDNEGEEARLIAYHMREVLETPEKTAALVTPSRRLSVKVAAELKRWGVHVEVTAGQLLSESHVGQYLRLIADACESDLRPVKLLGLLQHPLAAAGMQKSEFTRLVALMERHLLRGHKPDKSFAGLEKKITTRKMQGRHPLNEETADTLFTFIKILREKLSPLNDLNNERTVPLSQILRTHIQVAENLAATHDTAGGDNLWKGEDGIRLAKLLSDILPDADSLDPIQPADYPAFFTELIGGESFSQPYSHHPRLSIWGTMEARLQTADLMILGGLDEDVWPQSPVSDAWMSPPMRGDCGLPPVEHRIGLSAHDFLQAAASADEVILTRAGKREGMPMTPSRWWERIEAVLTQNKYKQKSDEKRTHINRLLNGDYSASIQFPRPSFCPPLQARPTEFYVTQFATLRQDPYAIYAQKILQLTALAPVEEPQEAAVRGKIIHRILQRAIEDEDKKFDDILKDELGKITLPAAEEKFLRHKLQKIRDWFLHQGMADGTKPFCEERGQMTIGNWAISGRADRIDVDKDSACTIIDYKSGGTSSGKAIREATDPQLPLEAWMVQENAFADINADEVKALQIWHTAGQYEPFAANHKQGGEIKINIDGKNLQQALDNTKKLVTALMEIFGDKNASYICFPDANFAPNKRYNDYAYFERLDEWSNYGGGDE